MRERKTEIWVKWRGLVAEQQKSGQSVAAFCRERGLRSGQFFAWKKRLQEADAPQFVAVAVTPVAEVKHPVTSGAIEVRLDRGHSLVVELGFDARHLRALFSVLDAPASEGHLPGTPLEAEA